MCLFYIYIKIKIKCIIVNFYSGEAMELQDDIIDFDLIDIDSVDEQPSILARETINNSKDQSITTLLVCPECGELLELKLINVKEIECKCKCGYFEIISINEFFIHLSNQKVPKKFCQNPNKHKNNKVKVGSGYSDEQRNDFWKHKDEYIGRILEVKFKEETMDKKTKLISMQFPTFVCIREEGKKVSYN